MDIVTNDKSCITSRPEPEIRARDQAFYMMGQPEPQPGQELMGKLDARIQGLYKPKPKKRESKL